MLKPLLWIAVIVGILRFMLSAASAPRALVYRVVRSPIRLDGKLMDGRLAAPSLGQHTGQILRAAQFTRAEILELKRLGVTIPNPSRAHPKRPH